MTPEEAKAAIRASGRKYYHANRDVELSKKKTPESLEKGRAAYRRQKAANPERVLARGRRAKKTYREKPDKKALEAAYGAERYYRDHAATLGEKRARYRAKRIHQPWAKLLDTSRARAKAKGLQHDLTTEWAIERWTGACEVTRIPFHSGEVAGRGFQSFSPSIDRIIPEAGYTRANCRFVLWAVNAFKNDKTDAEMLMIAKAIVKNFSLSS